MNTIQKGMAPVPEWQRLGGLVGVDARAYPRDFGVFVRYHYALRRQFRARYALPPPLALEELEAFCDAAEAHSQAARV